MLVLWGEDSLECDWIGSFVPLLLLLFWGVEAGLSGWAFWCWHWGLVCGRV